MKAKVLLLAVAIMISGLSFSQKSNEASSTNCEKKVLNKIKRKMHYIDMEKYLNEGQKANFIVTCRINEENIVEVVDIRGRNQEIKDEIISTLAKHPVECKSNSEDSQFVFLMKFDLRPTESAY